jgi:DNA-binding response OmpR family regulator
MMPKLDGYETCKALKSREETRDIPVILLSAKGRNVDQKTGYEVGADDYITKPFSPRELVERIKRSSAANTQRGTPGLRSPAPAPSRRPSLESDARGASSR